VRLLCCTKQNVLTQLHPPTRVIQLTAVSKQHLVIVQPSWLCITCRDT
jgi:hypothetical protein